MEVGLTSYVSTGTGTCTPPRTFVRLASSEPRLSVQIGHLQLTSVCPTLRAQYRHELALVACCRRLLRHGLSTSQRRRSRSSLIRAEALNGGYLAALRAHACASDACA